VTDAPTTVIGSAAWRAAVADALDGAVEGASELGAVDYVVDLLGALDHDPPHIWAAPSAAGTGWLELGPWERHAWAQRIAGWRSTYDRIASGTATAEDLAVVHVHACEATYGDPAYGGNRGGAGWRRIGFPEPQYPPARSGQR
jgi:hypothetical protein